MGVLRTVSDKTLFTPVIPQARQLTLWCLCSQLQNGRSRHTHPIGLWATEVKSTLSDKQSESFVPVTTTQQRLGEPLFP